MLYRRAIVDDVQRPDFRALLESGVASHDVGLPVNRDKLFTFTAALIGNPSNYSAIAEESGRCVAYIGGITAEHAFYDRALLNVIAWYSTRPFAGMRLLTMCLQWAAPRPTIKSVCVSFNPIQRERLRAVLSRRYAVHDVGAVLIHV